MRKFANNPHTITSKKGESAHNFETKNDHPLGEGRRAIKKFSTNSHTSKTIVREYKYPSHDSLGAGRRTIKIFSTNSHTSKTVVREYKYHSHDSAHATLCTCNVELHRPTERAPFLATNSNLPKNQHQPSLKKRKQTQNSKSQTK